MRRGLRQNCDKNKGEGAAVIAEKLIMHSLRRQFDRKSALLPSLELDREMYEPLRNALISKATNITHIVKLFQSGHFFNSSMTYRNSQVITAKCEQVLLIC